MLYPFRIIVTAQSVLPSAAFKPVSGEASPLSSCILQTDKYTEC